MRGRAFLSRLSRAFKSDSAVISVESAFALPAILVTAFAVLEIGYMVLVIEMGQNAVSGALTQFRNQGELPPTAETDIRNGIGYWSHGLLEPSDVTLVRVDRYESLADYGKVAGQGGGAGAADNNQNEDETESRYPCWHVVVAIKKQFITPVLRMLPTKLNSFTYRYERIVSYLPDPAKDDGSGQQ